MTRSAASAPSASQCPLPRAEGPPCPAAQRARPRRSPLHFRHLPHQIPEPLVPGHLSLGLIQLRAGPQLTAWTQWILIAIEFGVGILAIWSLVSVFSHNPHSVPFTRSWFSWHSMGGVSGFVAASLIAVYMFSGWDTGSW